MKFNFRNVVLLAVGAGYLLMHAPQTFAKPSKAAPSKQKVTTPKKKKKAPPAPTPISLVTDMRKSVAFMAKSSKSGISTKSKTALPYWSALKSCNEAVDQIELGIRSKDDRMLKGLNTMGRSLSQLSTSWGVLRKTHGNLEVGRGLIALSKSYNVYNSNYGPVAARKRQGGKVSEQELARLDKCRTDTRKFKSQLVAMRSKESAGSQALRFIADLLYLCDQLDRYSGNDLKAYCGYCDQFDRLQYSMYGYGNVVQAWYPSYSTQWTSVSTSYTSITTSFTYQSWSSYESWDYTSQSARNCDGYYETTAAVSDISTEDIKSYSSYTRDFSEESAVEVSSEEMTAINAKVSLEEDEEGGTFAEEVSMSEDDKDADGISDEEDADDDNDGSKDAEDKDDDGDGIADTEDHEEVPDASATAKEDSEEEEAAEEDSGEEEAEGEEMAEEDSGEEEAAEEDSGEEETAEEGSEEEEAGDEEMAEEDSGEEAAEEENSAEEDPAEEDAGEEDSGVGEEDSGGEEEMAEEDSGGAEEDSGGGEEDSGGDDSGGGEEE